MNASKVTVSIVVESLSVDVVHGLLEEVAEHIDREIENGNLSMSDGDSVTWKTVRKDVAF